jgi:hypothetical protein
MPAAKHRSDMDSDNDNESDIGGKWLSLVVILTNQQLSFGTK